MSNMLPGHDPGPLIRRASWMSLGIMGVRAGNEMQGLFVTLGVEKGSWILVRVLGENIHASYRREMEKTWGPDHMGTLPEDYADKRHNRQKISTAFVFLLR